MLLLMIDYISLNEKMGSSIMNGNLKARQELLDNSLWDWLGEELLFCKTTLQSAWHFPRYSPHNIWSIIEARVAIDSVQWIEAYWWALVVIILIHCPWAASSYNQGAEKLCTIIRSKHAWPGHPLVSWIANKVNHYLLPHIILEQRRSIIVIVMLVSHVVVSLIKVDCVVLISIWGSGISQRWCCIPESAWKVQAIIFIPSIVCWLLQISNLLQKVR